MNYAMSLDGFASEVIITNQFQIRKCNSLDSEQATKTDEKVEAPLLVVSCIVTNRSMVICSLTVLVKTGNTVVQKKIQSSQ